MFAVGDLVVCVKEPLGFLREPWEPQVGGYYHVSEVFESDDDDFGINLAEDPFYDPEYGWDPAIFRKIDKADEGFCLWMRSMRPIKQGDKVFAEGVGR